MSFWKDLKQQKELLSKLESFNSNNNPSKNLLNKDFGDNFGQDSVRQFPFIDPIIVLAPMEDVTDSSLRSFIRMVNNCDTKQIQRLTERVLDEDGVEDFIDQSRRQLKNQDGATNHISSLTKANLAELGSDQIDKLRQGFLKPDVMVTEFTNCEGLNHSIGGKRVGFRLRYQSFHRPIVAQVWGITPEDYFLAAQKVVEAGFDGMDINMGCPVKKVIKMGACSALINNPQKAKEIVEATKQGLEGKIPLSIKTRLGFGDDNPEWLEFCKKELKPEALTVHFRTVKELSAVPARWQKL